MTKIQDQNPKLVPHDSAIAPDTPIPGRKIRSDSFTPSTASPDGSLVSRGLSNTDSEDVHELELHEGDSDHEYHEPIEEDDEGVVQQSNGHNGEEIHEEIVIAVPKMMPKKR